VELEAYFAGSNKIQVIHVSDNKKIVTLAENASLPEEDLRLIEAIQRGLPISARPYAEIAQSLCMEEADVIARLRSLQDGGVIKRMGVVVRHRQLGYRANGMVVWDIPDDKVDELGLCMGKFEFVTLCYQRPRRLPDWPYNLFCMIHGCDHEAVLHNVAQLEEHCGLHGRNHKVLFSKRCFKQRGAVYRNGRGADSARRHGDGQQMDDLGEEGERVGIVGDIPCKKVLGM
jgi:DNA-binding Lrp family transcriptional regulator